VAPIAWADAELVVQPDLGDAVDVAQALGSSKSGWLQAALEGGDDLGACVSPGAARAAHGQDEGPAEARVVAALSCWMRANSSGVQSVRPGLALFVVLSAVSVLLTMALPASSGWARISASWRARPRFAHHLASVLQCGQRGEGPLAQAASAIQGECS
jgi:hypothetical protein